MIFTFPIPFENVFFTLFKKSRIIIVVASQKKKKKTFMREKKEEKRKSYEFTFFYPSEKLLYVNIKSFILIEHDICKRGRVVNATSMSIKMTN